MKKIECGVLVIGGGLGGMRAAIEAHARGADVLLVSKSDRGDPHSVLATGGINAALGTMDPQDDWKIHAVDTLREGKFLADYRAVEILCKNAPLHIREMVKWGVRFHRQPNGRLTQRFFGAHLYRRTCFFGDRTGKELVRAVFKHAKQKKVRMMDGILVAKILKERGEVVGALGIDFKKRKFVLFQCKSIVLAGGGFSRVYNVSSSRMDENLGEGVSIGYDAGADLIDMELVQFHPTGMVWPRKALGTLVTEAVRGEGGLLFNSKGDRFMKRYDPERMELGPRDEVAQSIWNEISEGRGTKHGGVYLDVTHLPKNRILKRLPKMYNQFKRFVNLDISEKRMEVAPTAHYSMGGLKTDLKGRTTVNGLFAVGEVTGGLHGGNRLGGNSLMETLVFGKITGRSAAEYSKKRKAVDVDANMEVKVCKIKGVGRFFDDIQRAMWKDVGLVRSAKGLRRALKNIESIGRRVERNESPTSKIDDAVIRSLEVKGMLVISEAIIKGALMRKESRAAHLRSDYPKQNDRDFKVNIHYRKDGKKMKIFKRRVRPLRGPIKSTMARLDRMKKKAVHHQLE